MAEKLDHLFSDFLQNFMLNEREKHANCKLLSGKEIMIYLQIRIFLNVNLKTYFAKLLFVFRYDQINYST